MTKLEEKTLEEVCKDFVNLPEENQKKIAWIIEGVKMATESKTK